MDARAITEKSLEIAAGSFPVNWLILTRTSSGTAARKRSPIRSASSPNQRTGATGLSPASRRRSMERLRAMNRSCRNLDGRNRSSLSSRDAEPRILHEAWAALDSDSLSR